MAPTLPSPRPHWRDQEFRSMCTSCSEEPWLNVSIISLFQGAGCYFPRALQMETEAQGRQPKVQKNRYVQVPELCPSAGPCVEMAQVGKQEAQDLPQGCHPGPSWWLVWSLSIQLSVASSTRSAQNLPVLWGDSPPFHSSLPFPNQQMNISGTISGVGFLAASALGRK